MAITLPTPLRVAAGIVASGIDLVRSLPEEIPALPVTLIGKAMQLSMKVQQEIADLATKGDELLSGVLGGPQENPPWAHFDDEPPTSTAIGAGSPQRDSAGTAVPGGAGSAGAGAARAAAARAATASTRVAEGGKAPVVTPLARSSRAAQPHEDARAKDEDTAPKAGKCKGDEAKQEKPRHDDDEVADASPPEDGAPSQPATTDPAASDPDAGAATGDTEEHQTEEHQTEEHGTEEHGTGRPDADPDATSEPSALEVPTGADSPATENEPSVDGELAAAADVPTSSAPVAAEQHDERQQDEQHDEQHDEQNDEQNGEPAALPDYDRMTLAQVRGYLRSLSAAEVQSLLDHEHSGESRAPFLTLLSNRLVTLEHHES